MEKYRFKRVLVKLSGEALAGKNDILDYEKISEVAGVLAKLHHGGLEMGIVVGGGNIYRGRNQKQGNRTDADHMGMLATTINALALKDAIIQAGAPASVMSAIEMEQICNFYTQRDALARIDRGEIVIFAGGIGRPYFSTDTASAMRALEINADVLLCGKNVDGVYDFDPNVRADAKRFDWISYDEFLKRDLTALDQTAIILCKNNNLKIFVFELKEPMNLEKAVSGELLGSIISETKA